MHRHLVSRTIGAVAGVLLVLAATTGCGADDAPADAPVPADPTAARDSTIAAATALVEAFDPDALDVTSATGAFAACDAAGQARYDVQLAVRSPGRDTADRVREALEAQGWSGDGTTYRLEGSTAEIDDTPGAESGSIGLTVRSECGAGDPPLDDVEQLDLAQG